MMESTLHEMYSLNRINGEWFEFTKTEIAELIERMPSEVQFFVEKLDRFSNINEDVKRTGRILGLRVEKLRGNFTPEEREQRKIANIEIKRLKKISSG